MDNFDELVDLSEVYVGPELDELYRRLLERNYAQEDIEVITLTAALVNILGHDNRGERPAEVLLIAA